MKDSQPDCRLWSEYRKYIKESNERFSTSESSRVGGK